MRLLEPFAYPPILGAFAAGVTSALVTGYMAENRRIKRATVMGVVCSGMFALEVILFAAFPSNAHLDPILFGDMPGAGPQDL